LFKIILNLLNKMKSTSLFFSKELSFATIATLFSLWLTVFLNSNHEEALGYFLILSVGILHGANDLKLLNKTLSVSRSIKPKVLLRNYIILVLLVGASFFVFPSVALLVFILMSAYHFGEQHWHHKFQGKKLHSLMLYSAYGLVIFSMLFYLNATETIAVIYGITQVSITPDIFTVLLYGSSILLLSITVYGYFKRTINFNILEELFLLVVFFIVFRMAALIWAFAIYFIFWHSLPSLLDQIKLLYGKSNKASIKGYIYSSLIYWIFAIVGLMVSIYFFGNDKDYFLPVFFAFLAAITLPHVLVMHKVMHQ